MTLLSCFSRDVHFFLCWSFTFQDEKLVKGVNASPDFVRLVGVRHAGPAETQHGDDGSGGRSFLHTCVPAPGESTTSRLVWGVLEESLKSRWSSRWFDVSAVSRESSFSTQSELRRVWP